MLLLLLLLLRVCLCVVSWLRFENELGVFYDNGSLQYLNSGPPSPPSSFADRYMHSALVYAATFATTEVSEGKGAGVELVSCPPLRVLVVRWWYICAHSIN